MIKNLAIPFLAFGTLYLLGYWLHDNYVTEANINLPFSLQKTYAFHALFSILLLLHFEFLSKIEVVRPQLGLIYLVSVVLKLILFSLLFKPVVIDKETLAMSTKYALLIPALVFLLFEVVFVAKILLRKQPSY